MASLSSTHSLSIRSAPFDEPSGEADIASADLPEPGTPDAASKQAPSSIASNLNATTPSAARNARVNFLMKDAASKQKSAQKTLKDILRALEDPLIKYPYVRSQLNPDQINVIRGIENLLAAKVDRDFGTIANLTLEADTEAGEQSQLQEQWQKVVNSMGVIASASHTYEAKAAAWTALSMLAKNFLVWNGPRIAAKYLDHLLPNDLAKITTRTFIGFLAGIIEYKLMEYGHTAWKKTGRNLPTAAAGIQALDMGSAIASYPVVGDKTGGPELINLASSVIGVLIGSGIIKLGKGTDTITPIFPEMPGTQLTSEENRDLEAGGAPDQPKGKAARTAATYIRRLTDSITTEKQELNVERLQTLRQQAQLLVEELRGALTLQQEAVQEIAEGEDSITTGAEVIEHLENYISLINALIGEPDAADDKIGGVIKKLKTVKTDLDQAGGQDWKKWLFYGFLTGGYVTGMAVSFKIEGLAPKSVGNILVSSLPQMPANLIPAALPDTVADWKKTAVAISCTPFEFLPLQMGFLYGEQYKELADDASKFAQESSAFIKSAGELPIEDLTAGMENFKEKASTLARKCGKKAPQLAEIINKIVEKISELEDNLLGERGEQLITELSQSIVKLANEGKGAAQLIPDTRGYQELVRLTLQFLFARVELKQNLELKGYASLLVPGMASLGTHLYTHFKGPQ